MLKCQVGYAPTRMQQRNNSRVIYAASTLDQKCGSGSRTAYENIRSPEPEARVWRRCDRLCACRGIKNGCCATVLSMREICRNAAAATPDPRGNRGMGITVG